MVFFIFIVNKQELIHFLPFGKYSNTIYLTIIFFPRFEWTFQMNAIDSRGVRDPELDSTSDLDEPMGSQSADVEAPLTHNSSKSNFFASPESEQVTPDQQLIANSKTPANRGSFKTHVRESSRRTDFFPISYFYSNILFIL